jgi:hypothetical protein
MHLPPPGGLEGHPPETSAPLTDGRRCYLIVGPRQLSGRTGFRAESLRHRRTGSPGPLASRAKGAQLTFVNGITPFADVHCADSYDRLRVSRARLKP